MSCFVGISVGFEGLRYPCCNVAHFDRTSILAWWSINYAYGMADPRNYALESPHGNPLPWYDISYADLA